MYKSILVTLDRTTTDQAIITHVRALARLAGSRVMLLHVADGWAARMYGSDAVSPEVSDDAAYLERVCAEFKNDGISVETHLAYGDPATEIIKWVEEHECDLVAMGTHGHRFMSDLFLGATATRVRHSVNVPVLLLKAK